MSDNKEIFEMENSPIKETKKQKKTRKPLNEDEKQKLMTQIEKDEFLNDQLYEPMNKRIRLL